MSNKIAGVTVLFYPTDNVIENIKSYIGTLGCLYVIDNSDEPNLDLLDYFDNDKVKYLHKGENLGISKALNLALKQAESDGYNWLLTMDQDTFFPDSSFKKYVECFSFISEKNKNIVLYSPLHNRLQIKNKNSSDCKYSLNEIFMTSANLVNVNLINKLGGFNDDLFIDEVDHELCLRVMKNGYNTLLFNSIYVNHTLGVEKKIKNRYIVRLYPASRIYYMVRNFLYIKKRYKKTFKKFIFKREVFYIKFIFKNLIFSKEKLMIISMLFKAFWDAYNNKYGKRVEIWKKS
ncbi:glycosyltransferase [Hydrogenimonas thermophila]|uniref:glycosyltransferase n=1 Tax=Hydrogenimonas thermophila TaxID=223786 RepID=UPI002936F05D|nr:glycosyltransferase [Hydrogenimonas thermophila]WOE69453.1 glycosyltransferase [Hydrogenimonas thermophila]WOE71964.1 glycosyltransferase [Hydrogenimonas thermophila]